MPKFLVCGDVHQNATGPGARKDTWPDDINAKLEFISNLAEKHKCDAILQLGDLWHLKNPARTPHWLIQATHKAMTTTDVPWYIVAGNHDEQNDRYDSISRQPLGTLSLMKNMHLVAGPSKDFPEVFGIPYLQDWAVELPQHLNAYNEYMDAHPEIKKGFIITHMSLFPEKDAPIYEFISDEDLSSMIKHPTTVAHGHLHFEQGVRNYGDVEIINYGSISRGSLHAETIKRQPKVYIYNTDTGKHRTYNVPVRPAGDVFDLETHALEKDRSERLTAFLEGVGDDEGMSVQSVDQMVEHLSQSDNVSPQVKQIVSDLLEHAQS